MKSFDTFDSKTRLRKHMKQSEFAGSYIYRWNKYRFVSFRLYFYRSNTATYSFIHPSMSPAVKFFPKLRQKKSFREPFLWQGDSLLLTCILSTSAAVTCVFSTADIFALPSAAVTCLFSTADMYTPISAAVTCGMRILWGVWVFQCVTRRRFFRPKNETVNVYGSKLWN